MAPFLKNLFCVFSRLNFENNFIKMSNRKDKDSDQDISVNSVERILFDEETQENNESKVTKKKEKRLSTSPTQKSGSGSPGKTRKKPKIIPTPPDATGLVRIDKESGTLKVDTKAVALENKKLKTNEGILQDQIVALRAQLANYENPGSQTVPSPTSNTIKSGGLAGALSTSQYNDMLSYIGEQVKLYQDTQTASKLKKKLPSKAPSVDPKAPGPSNRIAPINSGSAGKSRPTASYKNLGESLRALGDDLDNNGSVDDHHEDILG